VLVGALWNVMGTDMPMRIPPNSRAQASPRHEGGVVRSAWGMVVWCVVWCAWGIVVCGVV
jgi:hypothetical protein